jgi:hypothetical protein
VYCAASGQHDNSKYAEVHKIHLVLRSMAKGALVWFDISILPRIIYHLIINIGSYKGSHHAGA